MNKPNAVDPIHFMEVLRILKCVWSGMYTKRIPNTKFLEAATLFTNLAAETNFYSFISKTLYNNKIRRMANFAKTIICEVSKPQLEDDS